MLLEWQGVGGFGGAKQEVIVDGSTLRKRRGVCGTEGGRRAVSGGGRLLGEGGEREGGDGGGRGRRRSPRLSLSVSDQGANSQKTALSGFLMVHVLELLGR
jgi:hypothetical protein